MKDSCFEPGSTDMIGVINIRERRITMKKLTAIIGMCMIGFIAQAGSQDFEQALAQAGGQELEQTATVPTQGQSVKSQKHWDPVKLLACIERHIAERQTELQEATSKGHADIAAAIQKIITDLTAMKTALNNKDRAAFKTANEQRKQDREALEALRKTDRQANKNNKTSGSTTSGSTAKP